MQFTYMIIYVKDVVKSLEFYKQAFGFKIRFVHENSVWGELDTGSTILAFSSHQFMTSLGKKTSHSNAKAPCFEIAFTTPDVNAALEQALSAGAQLISPAEQMAWGQTVAYIADPDQTLIEICTPVNG